MKSKNRSIIESIVSDVDLLINDKNLAFKNRDDKLESLSINMIKLGLCTLNEKSTEQDINKFFLKIIDSIKNKDLIKKVIEEEAPQYLEKLNTFLTFE